MGALDLLKRLASRLMGHVEDAGFRLPDSQYGLGDTERCVEIPWALSWYRGEQRVLDIGYANAEDRYIDAINALKIPELYGLDLVGRLVPGIRPVVGDVRSAPFRDGSFDLILCISTLEHVGRDNSIYFSGRLPQDPEGDLRAIREMARMTRMRGRIVITVPYGRGMNYGWFQQYDKQSLERLISASGCRLIRKDLYIYREGWHHSSEEEIKDILYRDNNAPAAAGLACILLER